MGYFDALADSSFKKGSDGRWLFFPHGVLGRGYIIESEQDYQTLRRRFLAFIVPSLVLVFGALVLLGIAGGVVAGLIYMLVHLLWTRSQVRGLQPSAERLSWKETMSAQAIAHNAVFLWFGLIALLAFVALGIFLLIADGRDWPVLLGAVMFFGICAAAFAYMLVLRRRGKADAALREHDNAR